MMVLNPLPSLRYGQGDIERVKKAVTLTTEDDGLDGLITVSVYGELERCRRQPISVVW